MKHAERRMTGDAKYPVKLEARAEGQSEVIAGYGAVFYNGTPESEYVLWDYSGERAVERIMPGAFSKALQRPDDVRGLFNHDENNVLGRTKSGTMSLSADAIGLGYQITPGDTTIAKDVLSHLKRGDVSGSSFAFTVDEERWTETKDENGKWNVVREIQSVTLYDVGPVTYPAYESSTSGLRSDGKSDDAKRSLDAFRESQKPTELPLPAKLACYRSRVAEVVAEAL